MFRVIVLLIVGIAIGYFLGFSDAQTHESNIVKRLVSRAGASARGGVNNDIDARVEKQVGR